MSIEGVVPPEKHFEVYSEEVRKLAAYYGCVMALDSNGRAQTRGTVTFVTVNGRKLLLTAEHVYRAMKSARLISIDLHEFEPSGQPIMRRVVKGPNIKLEPRMIKEDLSLDVAFLEVPPEMNDLAGIRWFDLSSQDAAFAWLRRRWKEFNTEHTTLPIFTLGFPNFGALEYAAQRIQVHASVPMITYLSSWCESESTAKMVPQMHLEFEADTIGPQAEQFTGYDREIVRRLFD